MRVLLCIVMALLFFSPVVSQAQTAQPDAIEVPSDLKGFFDDYAALMKKYPAAAARFGVFDRKYPTSVRNNSTPLLRSSFCTGGSRCCTKWVDEGSGSRCVECSECLP
jgi:hypothetical protein